MRTAIAAGSLVVLLVVTPRAIAAPVEARTSGCVRPLTREAAELLEDAVRRSPLVRSQVAIIGASDLVVYLTQPFEAEAGEPKGKLQFVSAAGGRRYVLVCVARWKVLWNERLVLLAHELQHAVEVAAAPDVTDRASFTALFSRIGWQMRAGRFETEAARQASRRMRSDLQDLRPATPTPTDPPGVDGGDDTARDSRTYRGSP